MKHNRPAMDRLRKKYPADKFGLWQVRGEDSNCDLAGPHHMPNLGLFQGLYGEVLKHAADLDNFWQWGGGGSVTLVEVTTLSYASEAEAIWGILKSKGVRRVS